MGLDDDHGLPEALKSVPREAGVDEGARQFRRKPVFRQQRKLPLAGPAVGPERACPGRNCSCAPEAVVPVQRVCLHAQAERQPQLCAGADQGTGGCSSVGAINRSEKSSCRDAEVGSPHEWLRAGANGTQHE